MFLDTRCTERLPLQLPKSERLRVHRICVATGAADRCRAAIGQTSLSINVNVTDDAKLFTVGRVQGVAGWLHVLDGVGLNLLLDELSTISDVIAYLDAKAKLLDGGMFQGASSEADLLAQYLWHGRSFPSIPRPYVVQPNLWQEIETNAAFQAGRRENALSYFWDGLIEYLTEHYLQHTLEFGNELEVGEYEEVARIMASESRFHRRVLSKAILERADKARDTKISTLLPSEQVDVVYVVLIGRGAQGGDYAEYRADRSRELQLRCCAAKAARPNCLTSWASGRDVRGTSEDFVYLDTDEWTDEVLAGAVRIREEMQYFLPGRAIESRVTEEEYPKHEPGFRTGLLGSFCSLLCKRSVESRDASASRIRKQRRLQLRCVGDHCTHGLVFRLLLQSGPVTVPRDRGRPFDARSSPGRVMGLGQGSGRPVIASKKRRLAGSFAPAVQAGPGRQALLKVPSVKYGDRPLLSVKTLKSSTIRWAPLRRARTCWSRGPADSKAAGEEPAAA